MSNNPLDRDEVSDEALEAAAKMDQAPQAITFVTPICPDPGSGHRATRD